MHKRTWLRVVVFPGIIALINGAGISFFYILNALGWFDFRLEGFAWFAWGYPLSVFFVLATFSILKLRAETKKDESGV